MNRRRRRRYYLNQRLKWIHKVKLHPRFWLGWSLLIYSFDDSLDLRNGVGKKRFESATEIIQSRLTVRRTNNSVFGAFAPAIRQVRAFAAIFWQCFAFGCTKLILAPGINHVAKMAGF